MLQVEPEPWMHYGLFQSLSGNGVPLPILVALLSSAFDGISWMGPGCERQGNDEDDAMKSAVDSDVASPARSSTRSCQHRP